MLKKNINLFFSKFKLKANLTEEEPKKFKLWGLRKVYKKNSFFSKNKKLFLVHDGPPFANGKIHMGHFINKIVKDIIIRFWEIKDFNSILILGWDCHGLPIELEIEKKMGTVIKKERICKIYAKIFVKKQKKAFKNIGLSNSHNFYYATFFSKYKYETTRSLEKIIRKKIFEGGKKPIYWCYHCNSSLSEYEIEYKKKFVKKMCYNSIIFNKSGKIFIGTLHIIDTYIEKIKGLLYNENYLYILIKKKHGIFIAYKGKKGKGNFFIKKIKGITLMGCLVINLLDNSKFQIINKVTRKDENVLYFTDPENFFIFNLYKKKIYFLKKKKTVKLEHILNRKQLGNYYYLKKKRPYCWRHKIEVFFTIKKQWFFIVSSKLKKKLVRNVTKIDWGEHKYAYYIKRMILIRPNWCLSRQRIWGTLLPILDKKSITYNGFEKIVKSVSYNILIDKHINIKDKNVTISKNQVLDVWFDSSNSFNYLLKNNFNAKYPSNIVVEGKDQYRGWFQVSFLISLVLYNSIPYKKIFTHGFIVDKNKKKMSKSLKNSIRPYNIVNKVGIEVLRLWVSSLDYKKEIILDLRNIKKSRELYQHVRNTIKFLLTNLEHNKYSRSSINNILLDQMQYNFMIKENFLLKNGYKNIKFFKVIGYIKLFFLNLLGNFYINNIKDRLYISSIKSTIRKKCQIFLNIVTCNLIRYLYPILPFTVEEVLYYVNKKNVKGKYSSRKTGFKKKVLSYNKKEIWFMAVFLRKKLYKEMGRKKVEYPFNTNLTLFFNYNLNNITANIKKEINKFLLLSNTRLNILETKRRQQIRILVQKEGNYKCNKCWNKLLSKKRNNLCLSCCYVERKKKRREILIFK